MVNGKNILDKMCNSRLKYPLEHVPLIGDYIASRNSVITLYEGKPVDCLLPTARLVMTATAGILGGPAGALACNSAIGFMENYFTSLCDKVKSQGREDMTVDLKKTDYSLE
jgi:hypothetical protein